MIVPHQIQFLNNINETYHSITTKYDVKYMLLSDLNIWKYACSINGTLFLPFETFSGHLSCRMEGIIEMLYGTRCWQ